ncbi:MAG TPA: ATP-binding protein [Chitinophagaceae bacterium]|nr:ATP-binding protein [Chitinophagaceae bacterium]
MIRREAEARLKKLGHSFRSVAVIGPRQSGKTTLCRFVFPKKPYVSMENPDTLEFARSDPRGFLGQYKNGAILDEVQRAPHLFSYLQQILDETNKKGLFILTGSNNFLLQHNITQTLAGRVGYLQLLPLSLDELKDAGKLKTNYLQAVITGGYPEIIARKVSPADWYRNYISTYVERDVRLLKNISNISLFLKFIRLCAGRTGSVLNLNSLANDCGVDQKTATHWMSILQASFVVYLLRPFHNNYNKRLIKTPKLYFIDTGLACSLAGIESAKQLSIHPFKGHFFENLLIMEALKKRLNKGLQDNLFFWRDKTGNEVDLLIDNFATINAYEIKAGETISNDYFKSLYYYAGVEQKKTKLHLLYGGKETQTRNSLIKVFPWNNFSVL